MQDTNSMTGAYATKLCVPDGFPEVLREFTREVLRDQPSNLYKYAAAYFAQQAAGASAAQANAKPDIDFGDLEKRVREMFDAADEEKKGYLDRKQALRVMSNVKDELRLNDNDLRHIMSEADENGDGVIDYNEFLPLAMSIMEALYAKDELARREVEAIQNAEEMLLHGLSKDELSELLRSIFTAADKDGSGALDRREFLECLKNTDLGLTRREINVLMHEVDENHDGQIDYKEFESVAFDLCVGITARMIANEDVPVNVDEARQFFEALFSSADVDGAGRLQRGQLGRLLVEADLGLTRVQIHAMLSEAILDDEGRADWADFAGKCAIMLSSVINFEEQEAMARRREHRNTDAYKLVLGLDRTSFTELLASALSAAEEEISGSVSGALPVAVVKSTLTSTFPEMDSRSVEALLSLCFEAEDAEEGTVLYDDAIAYGFQVLQSIKDLQVANGV